MKLYSPNKNLGLGSERYLNGYVATSADPNEILEHNNYTYIALPNFNIMGAKHILPYDLRIPRDWKDSNIYRSLLPVSIGLGTTNLYNKKYKQ